MSRMKPALAGAPSTVFDLGDVLSLAVEIVDDTDVLADAGAVTLTVTLPDGTTVAPAVTHTGVGTYSVAYPPPLAGRYSVRWVATGANASAYDDVFDVLLATPGFIMSLADAREQLRKPNGDVADDEELRLYIGAVTVIVEAAVGPQTLTIRTITRNGGKSALLLPTEAIAVTAVTENGGVLVPNGDYTIDPDAGIVYRGNSVQPFPFLPGHMNVTITFSAGQGIVGSNVRLAARIILRHLWQADQQGVRASARQDTEPTTVLAGYAVPNRAASLLAPTPSLLPGFA